MEYEVATVDLGFLDTLLGFRLKQAHHLLVLGGEARLQPLGITPQDFSILAMIAHNPGVIQSRLIENLYITRSTCSEMIEQLLQADLLRRTPLDRRSNGLFLTEKGQKILEQARAVINTHTATLTSHMKPEDVEALTNLLIHFSTPPD